MFCTFLFLFTCIFNGDTFNFGSSFEIETIFITKICKQNWKSKNKDLCTDLLLNLDLCLLKMLLTTFSVVIIRVLGLEGKPYFRNRSLCLN